MSHATRERIQQYSARDLESIRGRASIQRERAIEQWRKVIPGMNHKAVLGYFLEDAEVTFNGGQVSEETLGQVTLLDLRKTAISQRLFNRWGRMEAVMERVDAEVQRRLLGAYEE